MPSDYKRHSKRHTKDDEPDYKVEHALSPLVTRGTFFAYNKTDQLYELRASLRAIKYIVDHIKQEHKHVHGPLHKGIKRIDRLFYEHKDEMDSLNNHGLSKLLHKIQEIARESHSTNPAIQSFYDVVLESDASGLDGILNQYSRSEPV